MVVTVLLLQQRLAIIVARDLLLMMVVKRISSIAWVTVHRLRREVSICQRILVIATRPRRVVRGSRWRRGMLLAIRIHWRKQPRSELPEMKLG